MSGQFVLATRQGCHLCEDMLEQLEPMLRGRAVLHCIDIDTHSEYRRKFDTRIPVLLADDQVVCEGILDRQAVITVLMQADL